MQKEMLLKNVDPGQVLSALKQVHEKYVTREAPGWKNIFRLDCKEEPIEGDPYGWIGIIDQEGKVIEVKAPEWEETEIGFIFRILGGEDRSEDELYILYGVKIKAFLVADRQVVVWGKSSDSPIFDRYLQRIWEELEGYYSDLVIKKPKRRYEHIGTEAGIQELREKRKEHIKRTGKAPPKIKYCELADIDPKTVIKHDPELWANWKNKNYL